MFKKAYEGGYAIGAFNVNNVEITQGITEARHELRASVTLRVSTGARKYTNHTYLTKLVEAVVLLDPELPIVLHLDHGPSFEPCKECIDGGFTSAMFDGSSKSYEENVEEARRVAGYAHKYNVTVEAELGQLTGTEDEVSVDEDKAHFIDPDQVEDFVKRTGMDSSATVIGASYGAYRFKPGQKPQLRFDIPEEVSRRLPGLPIVLHDASSVTPQFVEEINRYGGSMPDTIGIPEEMLRQAVTMTVCKINIDPDLRLAMTASVRKYLAENPSHFNPRRHLGSTRAAIKEMVEYKINTVLGYTGRAWRALETAALCCGSICEKSRSDGNTV